MGRTRQALPAAAILAVASAAAASETTAYSYDALGRLVAVSTAGGPNGGMGVSTGYDRVGNRSNYSVTGMGSSPPPGALPSVGQSPSSLDDVEVTEGPVAPSPPIVNGIPQEEEPVPPEVPEGQPPPAETPGADR
jgi:YD repeat-containing protein